MKDFAFCVVFENGRPYTSHDCGDEGPETVALYPNSSQARFLCNSLQGEFSAAGLKVPALSVYRIDYQTPYKVLSPSQLPLERMHKILSFWSEGTETSYH